MLSQTSETTSDEKIQMELGKLLLHHANVLGNSHQGYATKLYLMHKMIFKWHMCMHSVLYIKEVKENVLEYLIGNWDIWTFINKIWLLLFTNLLLLLFIKFTPIY